MLQRNKQPFTLFKRPGGTIWAVRFSAGGKQIRKSLDTEDEDEAERKAYALWGEANYRVKNGLTATTKPFSQVAEELIERVKKESQREHRSEYHPRDWPPVIRRYFIGFFRDRPVEAIREADLERYLEWRREYWVSGPGKDIEHIHYERGGKVLKRKAEHKVPSLSRQKNEAVILKALFKQSVKWGYSKTLDMPDIKVRKRIDSRRPSFTLEEFERLITTSLSRIYPHPDGKTISSRDGRQWTQYSQNRHIMSDRLKLHAHIEIAAGSGMRPTELKNLNWGHITNFKANRQNALGDRDVRMLVQGKGKHGKLVPHIGVISWLDALWDRFEAEVGRQPEDDDPVFANIDGSRIQSFKKGFAELLKACNLQTDYRGVPRTTYSLRHYYISEMIASGADVYDIARNTRTSIAMIDKHYGQVDVERLKDRLRPADTRL